MKPGILGDTVVIRVTEANFNESVNQVLATLVSGAGVEADCSALTDDRQRAFHQACQERIRELPNGKRIQTIEVNSQEELEQVVQQLRERGGPDLSSLLERDQSGGGAINLGGQHNIVPPAIDELAMARQAKQRKVDVRAFLLADCDFAQTPFTAVLTTENYAFLIDKAIEALKKRRPVLLGLGLLPPQLAEEASADMETVAEETGVGVLSNTFFAADNGKILIDGEEVEPSKIGEALSRSIRKNFGEKLGAAPAPGGPSPAMEKLMAHAKEQANTSPDAFAHAKMFDDVYARNRDARADAAEHQMLHELQTDIAMKAAMGAAAFLTLLEHDPETARDREALESMFSDLLVGAVETAHVIEDRHELELPAMVVVEYGHARDLESFPEDARNLILDAQGEVLRTFQQTTDAALWATALLITIEDSQESIVLDTSFLLGWFANAIEAGRAAGIASVQAQVKEAYQAGIKYGTLTANAKVAEVVTPASPLNSHPTGSPLAGGIDTTQSQAAE